MRAYIPPMRRIPEGASRQEREAMFEEYRATLVAMNPGHFHSDGTLRSFLDILLGRRR